MKREAYIQRLLNNPVFGLVPFLLFSILIDFFNPQTALLLGFGLSAVAQFGIKKQSRILYEVSAITFALSFFILSLFISIPIKSVSSFLLVEALFVLVLILYRLSRSKIVYFLCKNTKPSLRYYMRESFHVAFQTQYGLSIHLLFIFLLSVIDVSVHGAFNPFFIKLLPQIFIILIIAFQLVKSGILNRKLRNEEWLPVVNEFGGVTGKIASSVARDMKNRYMHPVVRVALIHDNMIYLKHRDKSRLLNPDMLDYPFEKYMKFNHNPEESVQSSIQKECGNENLPVRFLLKYFFENEATKRLIILYALIIEDKETFDKLNLDGGKLWTVGQIEDNLGNDIFSECFELEFEYLKNTVLMTNNHDENQVIA